MRLVYHRIPDHTDTFEQERLGEERGCHITLLRHAPIPRSKAIDGRTVLEPGAPIVWFTFEGAWHDIGRFHNAAGEFTGYYANVITPVCFHDSDNWECTDLMLDVWLGPDGVPRVLDEDEFDAAVRNAQIPADLARRAEIEIRQILAGARAGTWPPAVAQSWTLDRIRTNN